MRLPIHLQREIARLHFYDTRQSHRMVMNEGMTSNAAPKPIN